MEKSISAKQYEELGKGAYLIPYDGEKVSVYIEDKLQGFTNYMVYEKWMASLENPFDEDEPILRVT